MNFMARLGILLSGRGSNFLAIAENIVQEKLTGCEIAVVISNKADAPGLDASRMNAASKPSPSKPEAASAPSTTPKSSPACAAIRLTSSASPDICACSRPNSSRPSRSAS